MKNVSTLQVFFFFWSKYVLLFKFSYFQTTDNHANVFITENLLYF